MAINAETRFTSADGATITGIAFDDQTGTIEIWQERLTAKKQKQKIMLSRDVTMNRREIESFGASVLEAVAFMYDEEDEEDDYLLQEDE